MEKYEKSAADKNQNPLGTEPIGRLIGKMCIRDSVHEDIVKKVQENMPGPEELQDLADFFKVFGDSTRIKILCMLWQSEMCVCDLAQSLSMTQSAISHQLRVLKQMKLVTNRREGKTV